MLSGIGSLRSLYGLFADEGLSSVLAVDEGVNKSSTVTILGRGSTGRTELNNLYEKLKTEEAKSNPWSDVNFDAKILDKVPMRDSRWHKAYG